MRKRASKVCWPAAAWSSKATLRSAHACICRPTTQGCPTINRTVADAEDTPLVCSWVHNKTQPWQRHFKGLLSCANDITSDGQRLRSVMVPGFDIKHLGALWASSASCRTGAPRVRNSAGLQTHDGACHNKAEAWTCQRATWVPCPRNMPLLLCLPAAPAALVLTKRQLLLPLPTCHPVHFYN